MIVWMNKVNNILILIAIIFYRPYFHEIVHENNYYLIMHVDIPRKLWNTDSLYRGEVYHQMQWLIDRLMWEQPGM